MKRILPLLGVIYARFDLGELGRTEGLECPPKDRFTNFCIIQKFESRTRQSPFFQFLNKIIKNVNFELVRG